MVASLKHVIESKNAVARPKDLRVLPELEEPQKKHPKP